ncbi:MAG TPA: ThiF family adenylyltransferase [Chthoniobacterales bacterium]|jgi:hypothetical protein|nr:ThiF family adenylyltransferase [Chthoniobacterales bacterium]
MGGELQPIEVSRLAATAAFLGDAAADRHTFLKKAVLLTGELETLATPNGRACFFDALRLLMKMSVDRFHVLLPARSGLDKEVENLIDEVALKSRPEVRIADQIAESYDAILSVGTIGDPDRPLTVVNSNGWIARVASTGKSLPRDCSQFNRIGALGAACLGVAEVFKRLVILNPEKGELHDYLSFSFYTYKEADAPGPELPKEVAVDVLLVGLGAIGNATLHLLLNLPFTGSMTILDFQQYGIENWGTCFLVTPKDIDRPKIDAAKRWVNGRFRLKACHQTIEDYLKTNAAVAPRLVINGLDNVSARRAVQDLWPDNVFDGAIGPVSAEVTVHPWGLDLSCLKCDFPEPEVIAEEQQIRATGLRRERLLDSQSSLTEQDIAAAAPEYREFLSKHLGKPVCSVVSEGVIAMLSRDVLRPGFEPSVAFVAALSSCMLVTELIRYVQKDQAVLETGFQFDVMRGPQFGLHKAHARKSNCVCVERRQNIEAIRARRHMS